jgi:hypothetical protein
MAQSTIEAQVYVELEQNFQPTQIGLATEFEIDGTEDDDFGTLYRLCKNSHFVGSFYQTLDGKWVAQPSIGQVNGEFDTEEQVILAIIAATSTDVFASKPDIDSLLDKQFDSLTAAEWQYLMTITPDELESYCHLETEEA